MKLRRRSPEKKLTGERSGFNFKSIKSDCFFFFLIFTSFVQAQRELDDYVESNEGMNREINNLKNKLR